MGTIVDTSKLRLEILHLMEQIKSVYLDYNATTPLDADVLDVIHETLKTAWGNPSSKYPEGGAAKHAITEARQHLASMLGGNPSDIVFTSGGTEANNQILNTALHHFQDYYKTSNLNSQSKRPHFITSNLEHDSIKLVLEHYQEAGIADVTFVKASHRSGRVEVDDILSAVTPRTCMITIMTANNETGVIQPIAEISERIKLLNHSNQSNMPILLHTDAAQVIGKIKVNIDDLGVDYLTIVGHKFYAPRIGAVYVKNLGVNRTLTPLLFGGG